MYKVTIGHGLRRHDWYFLTLKEAQDFCRSLGLSPNKIKPIH